MKNCANPVAFNHLGRIRGHHVYLLLCGSKEEIFIKVGCAADPLSRLDDIRTGCPFVPDTMATVHVVNKAEAYRIERVLQVALKRWSVHGEWFRLTQANKVEFNFICSKVLADFSRPSWPLKLVKISAAKYISSRQRNMRFARKRWKEKGSCYQTFTADLRVAQTS